MVVAILYALYEIWLREVNQFGECVLTEFGERAVKAIAILNAVVYSATYVLLLLFNGTY